MKITSIEEALTDIDWEDILYGDVCIFKNGLNEKFVGMKVWSEHVGKWVVDLSANPSALYKDGNVYKVVKKLKDVTLTIKT